MYYDIYTIIIGLIPYTKYKNMRLVCKEWGEIVENSDYKEILSIIRIVSRDPDFNNKICMPANAFFC